MLCLLDYVHRDDTFPTECSSGLEGVRVIGIDREASEARHLSYIREQIPGTEEYRRARTVIPKSCTKYQTKYQTGFWGHNQELCPPCWEQGLTK